MSRNSKNDPNMTAFGAKSVVWIGCSPGGQFSQSSAIVDSRMKYEDRVAPVLGRKAGPEVLVKGHVPDPEGW